MAIIDGYGDAIDWSGWTLENIIGEVYIRTIYKGKFGAVVDEILER